MPYVPYRDLAWPLFLVASLVNKEIAKRLLADHSKFQVAGNPNCREEPSGGNDEALVSKRREPGRGQPRLLTLVGGRRQSVYIHAMLFHCMRRQYRKCANAVQSKTTFWSTKMLNWQTFSDCFCASMLILVRYTSSFCN